MSAQDLDPAAAVWTPEMVREADGRYRPFPSMAEWLKCAVDERRWAQAAASLEEVRKSGKEALAHSLQIVRRVAAVDTGALEGLYPADRGFTFTVATQAHLWEQQLEKRGNETKRLIEDQIEAYDRIVDLLNNQQPLTEAAIREFHRSLCRSQKTYEVRVPIDEHSHRVERRPFDEKGAYKTRPNHVLTIDGKIHAHCPVEQTGPEMHRLVDELNSDQFASSHPVVQAAFVHYALVVIHPFVDGNGRVARLLASLYLVKQASIPMLVLLDDRSRYLHALADADQGNLQAWLDFVFERGTDAFRLVEASFHNGHEHPLDEALSEIVSLYQTKGKYEVESVDDAANALLRTFQDAFSQQLKQASTKANFSTYETHDLKGAGFALSGGEGFRSTVRGYGGFKYSLVTPPPAQAQVHGMIHVEVPRDSRPEDAFLICWLSTSPQEQAPETVFRATVAECMSAPQLTPTLKLLIEMRVQGLLGRILKVLVGLAARDLTRRGY